MLSLTVYPIIWLIGWGAFLFFLALLLLRLVFSYSDPNPFGAVGRFSFKIRKITERFVYPAAQFLSSFRVDTRLAPLVTAFISLVITYFGLQIIGNAFFIIDGLTASIATGNVRATVGFIIYGLLSLFVLFLIFRFVGQWFVFARTTFLAFVYKVTDPVMIPAQRLIPRVGMFDFSLLVVLIVVSILQAAVIALLVR